MDRGTILSGLAALLLVGCSAEAPASEAPASEVDPAALELTGRVVDAADVLGAEVEADLTERLQQLEADSGVQLVVVSTPSLGGKDVADYTLALGNRWGIGDADRKDGLILLVAPNDQKARIEVGIGLTEIVTNEEAQHIMDTILLPEFARGQYEIGLRDGTEALASEVAPLQMEAAE